MTVTELNGVIKQVLEGLPLLQRVSVKGEISNLKIHSATGHIYLTLKDDGSVIRAVMFRGNASSLSFRPENGMKVCAEGRIGVYTRDGSYQLYIDEMQQDGVGALYIAFEQLKQKLLAKGLFDREHKKRVPKIAFRIGIITASTGAAVRDMINVTRRRFPAAKILIYPSLVQGDGAARQLTAGIKYLDENRLCDVIIIGRGGGSIEDLWAFNDEGLAYAIYNCTTPVISAVGHETDFTICDFVADLRAPTPSAAAELAVPDSNELKIKFGNLQNKLLSLTKARLDASRSQLRIYSERQVMQDPLRSFDERREYVSRLSDKLQYSLVSYVSAADNRVKAASQALSHGPAASIASAKGDLDVISQRLTHVGQTYFDRTRHRLQLCDEKLASLDPLGVLKRGYAAVFSDDGNVISSASQAFGGQMIGIRLADGSIGAEVKEINGGKQ